MMDLHDHGDDGGDWQQLTPEQTLALIKQGRRNMLLLAIDVLERVTPQRAMEAGLEVLRAALADLDHWADGMAIVLERDRLASLDELRQH